MLRFHRVKRLSAQFAAGFLPTFIIWIHMFNRKVKYASELIFPSKRDVRKMTG
jgi:hypothetical protein